MLFIADHSFYTQLINKSQNFRYKHRIMKKIVALVACVLVVNCSFAQNSKHGKNGSAGEKGFSKAEGMKNGVWGLLKDMNGEPLADVEAMIYKQDTIVASGYSDASGRFVTSSCKPGKYVVHMVYPNSDKYIIVSGVEIKSGRVRMDLKANAPTQDSTISYAELMPKKKDNKNHSHH